jgi:hypothetical protein
MAPKGVSFRCSGSVTSPGCKAVRHARGWCQGHYMRWKRHGDPLAWRAPPRTYCTVEACDAPSHGRQLCQRHYSYWKHHGTTVNRRPELSMPILDRFSLSVGQTEGCWLWLGALNSQGYGRFPLKGRRPLAHRLSYMLAHGSIPDGLDVCHHCDNPPCVRPDHLFLGTASENIQDAIRKGRFTGRPRVTQTR